MAATNEDYWRERELKQIEQNIKDAAAYEKEIQSIYDDMLVNVQKEIDAFYANYAGKNDITINEAKKRASEMDIKAYEKKAQKYVKELNFSKEANEEMRLYNLAMKTNRLELLKANIGLETVASFDKMHKLFGGSLTNEALKEFERQAGILGKSITNNAEYANAIVNASFNNATYSQRIWMHQEMLKYELHKSLTTGLIQGKNSKVLAKEIQKIFGVNQYNAETLLRTEMTRVQIEAQRQSYERNGFEEYEYIAEPTACKICAPHDGKIYKVSEMQIALNAAPMHPNCRCSTAAYMDRDKVMEELGIKEKSNTERAFDRSNFKEYNIGNNPLQVDSDNAFENLSKDSQIALEGYTIAGYDLINSSLRSGQVSDQVTEIVKHMDNAMVMELKQSVRFTRGIGSDELKYIRESGQFKDYKSMSVAKGVAAEFAEDYDDGMLLKIYAPKGTRGLYVGRNTSFSVDEGEFILARDAKYKIISDKKGLVEVLIIE